MRSAVDAIVGLGGNLGETAATLSAAREALSGLAHTTLVAASSLYRTAPMGGPDQPDYLNAVCRLQTALAPEGLAAALFAVERRLGRIRTGLRNEPRVIDIDLLYYEGVVCEGPALILPHPRLRERAFVLYPWAEIMPDFCIPKLGALADLRRAVRDQRVERLERPW
ncbi:2-amino-4-hydroxy-6-hydroxymethyldihydropteridine diphosphokinase [Acidiferrobacter sp.]|uniref:2-amino-4-hydroxy-6- hydroxymethyldihydropteridine diphosphokinase n=1 Tax=Acidiferrobacter sp. TaxID=1872107 RepID=UPI002610C406|nr:2-amino-4-hydroxy-6-hydroxymethyldihydropteridine diphosphokinase [Acidiferrobacter sp.]